MKRVNHFYTCSFLFFICLLNQVTSQLSAQTKETTHPLTNASKKGLLNSAFISKEGTIVITYAMRVDKKSDELTYEDYVFDKDLNFKGTEPGTVKKEDKPDKESAFLVAYAGGGNSFNVLSQKLSIIRAEGTAEWNYKKQRYVMGNIKKTDKVRLRNNEDRYDGFAFSEMEDGLFIIGSYDPGKKGLKEQFVALSVDNDLNVKETPVTEEGNFSLVYHGERKSGNQFVIMAPKKGAPDPSAYVYAEFTPKAGLVKRSVFKSPSPNMMITDFYDTGKELFLLGLSAKGNDPYEEEFTDYSNMANPGKGMGGMSRQWQKYEEAVFKKDMQQFHLLKLSDGQLQFSSTEPVKDFEKKIITPPGQKKKTPYEGERLAVSGFTTIPSGGYLIAGQLLTKGGKYQDMIGLYFDSDGQLIAQYSVEKMNNDTKSEAFISPQNFYFSPDKKKAYWEIMEVKGSKGYANYWDALAGQKSFFENYFPRIASIDLESGSLSEFTVLGDKGKFLVYRNHAVLPDPEANCVYYFGHDDDFEKLWVGKYQFR